MIKFFAWESRWLKKVKDARNRELAVLIEDRIVGSCNEAVYTVINASVIGELELVELLDTDLVSLTPQCFCARPVLSFASFVSPSLPFPLVSR